MPNKPKGTYDVLPKESAAWAKLESTVRKICQIYNYLIFLYLFKCKYTGIDFLFAQVSFSLFS